MEQICNEESWKKETYNATTHNCQHFIAKIIEKLNAKRKINCKHDGRGYHNFSMAYFPPTIINQFEKNENDQNLQINKFPVLGQIEEGCRIIAEELLNLFK